MLMMTADERRYFLGPQADHTDNSEWMHDEDFPVPQLQVVVSGVDEEMEAEEDISFLKKCVSC